MKNGKPEPMPASGEQRVVRELPSWLASVAYKAPDLNEREHGVRVIIGSPVLIRVRVPVPPVAYLEQMAYQRDQFERACAAQAMTPWLGPPPPEPTFEALFQATEAQARAIVDALTTVLDAAARARDVVDVIDVD